MTGDTALLIPKVFSQVGVDDISDLAIIQSQDYGELYKVRGTRNVGHLNPFKLEQDFAALARQFVKDNPEIGVILLECAIFPPFAWAIQNAVDLLVFDYYTLINWIYTSVVRHPFAGFY